MKHSLTPGLISITLLGILALINIWNENWEAAQTMLLAAILAALFLIDTDKKNRENKRD